MSFEDFVISKFTDKYVGTKDDFEEELDVWLTIQDKDDFEKYADQYGSYMYKQGFLDCHVEAIKSIRSAQL